MQTTLLKGAKVILPDRELEGSSILISEDRIVSIDSGKSFPDTSEIDLSGTTVFPGFIDVHNHGADGWDVMNSSISSLLAISKFLQSQGVTGWLPTLVPASDQEYAQCVSALARVMDEQLTGTTRVLGVHYEGPFVNLAQCGALHKEHFKIYREPPDLEFLCTPNAGVRMITLAPEIEGGVSLIKELRERGWVISIGHSRPAPIT